MATEQVTLNRILLSYNPVLTICLACLVLKLIGEAVSMLKLEAEDL